MENSLFYAQIDRDGKMEGCPSPGLTNLTQQILALQAFKVSD